MTAPEMHRALETMGVLTVAPFDGSGYAGVQACCPVCAPGRVIWTEQTRKWVCNKPDCASRKNPSLIVDKFDEQHPRVGGFANGNGNGHRNEKVVVVLPNSRENSTTTTDRYAGRVHAPDAMTELVQQPEEPTPWRVHGLVADGTVTILSAEAGMGKSILLQALCEGVTAGRTTAGFLCAKGVAIYLDGEMGSKIFAGRMRKTGADKCAFWYVDALGLDISAEKPDDLGWVSGHVERTGASLVVIDSLRRLMPSKSENDSDDMAPAVGAVAKLARDTNAAIVLVHHKGDGEKFYRGSSAIKDQADALFGMLPVNPDDDDDGRMRITCRGTRGKPPRYDEAPPDRYVKVDFAEGGVVAVDAPEGPEPVVPLRHAVAAAIEAAMPVKYKKDAAEKIGRHGNDQTFRDAWDDLERAGRIVPVGGGWENSSSASSLENPSTTTRGFGSTPSSDREPA